MSQSIYKTNPIVSLDDTQFVSQLYGSGVGLVGAANTKTLTQNEQRIRGMITTDNLDYISKAGFLRYKVIKSNESPVLLDGTFNTLYTVFNPSSPTTGVDIEIKFNDSTFSTGFTLPAGDAINILIDGVGNVSPSVIGLVPSIDTTVASLNLLP